MVRLLRNVKLKRFMAILLCTAQFCVCVNFTTSAKAAGQENHWQLTEQVGGVTKAMYLEEDTLYIASGLHVMILDVSAPDTIRQIGSSPLLPQVAESVVSDGKGKLYVCCGTGGLVILDVSDPSNTQILGTLDTRGMTEGVAVYGNYAVLADGPQGVQVADISDPRNPKTVSEAYPLAYVYDVVVQDGVAYAAGGASGLFVIDLNDPLHPIESGLIALNGAQYDAELADGKLYLAGAWGGITVFDLTQPLSPQRTATVKTRGWAMALASEGRRLFVFDGANGIDLFGISGKTPMKISTVSYNGYVIAGATNGKKTYVLDEEKGLIFLDYSSVKKPKPLLRWIPLLDGRKLDMSDGICYVAGGLSGFHAFDTNVGKAPVETYWYDTGSGYDNEIKIQGDTAFLAMRLDANIPVMTFDVSDPYAIERIGMLDNSDAQYQIKGGPLMIDGQYAYMTGMKPASIDINDLTNLQVSDCIDCNESGNGDIRGNLFVARSTSEIYIIDRSDPKNLRLLSTMDVDSAGAAVRFISDTLILAATNYGVEVYDLSNPSNPSSVSKLDLPGDISDIFLDGTTAYLSAQGKGIHIIDISNPLMLTYLETVETLGCAWDCYLQDGMLYVADGTSGLTVFERTDTARQNTANKGTFSAHNLYVGPIEKASVELQKTPARVQRPTKAYTYIVTSTADSGTGTLREALETGRLKDNTTITFDPAVFPADNPATIKLKSNLSPIDCSFITIDASNAGVILDGNQTVEMGLDLYGTQIVVMGMQITGFTKGGIWASGAYAQIGGNRNLGSGPVGQGNQIGNCYLAVKIDGYGARVQGNLIGVDVTGFNAAPNWSGIFVTSGDNTLVGGTGDGEGNVVSASERGNITSWCDDVRIIGNIVGLDITGTKALYEQTEFGVFCELSAVNNIVGGRTPAERNVISGVQTGLIFGDQKTYQCTAAGNYIGTDITGMKAIPNQAGYFSYVCYHNRLGGTAPGEGNVISGNSRTGVDSLNDTFVLGNYIGVASDGATPLPNDYAVSLRSFAIIGGFTPEEGNLICGNTFSIMNDAFGVTGCYVAGNRFISKSTSDIWLQNEANGMFVQNNTFSQTNNFTILVDGGGSNCIRGNRFMGTKTADFINLVLGGNEGLPAPVVNSAIGNVVTGMTCPYGRVEIYVFEDQNAMSLGFADADENGMFTFESADQIGGKQVLLLVTDSFSNTSAFSKPYKVK